MRAHVFFLLTLVACSLVMADAASAQSIGMAEPWQKNFQEPATPVMERLFALHMNLVILITVISVFVCILLLYACWRYRASKQKKAAKFSHNTLIEVIWTTVPILILVAIAIPSLKLHYYMAETPEPDMTLKVTGYQWYWNYEYPEADGLTFDSYMIKDEDLKEWQPRLLAVDNPIVVPVDSVVRVLMTGGDVIHSWSVPAFGVKKDTLPGKLNETWFKATKIGTYYGQCSELCGIGHGFMPIEVHVVSKDDYKRWLKQAKRAYDNDELNTRDVLMKL
jgi:cytochrome c oxidase subunit 2